MLSIILNILGIIGKLLLCLLALILLILLIVLFVPVKYKAAASCYGNIKVQADLSWLLKLLHVILKFDPDNGVRIFKVNILGHTIIGKGYKEKGSALSGSRSGSGSVSAAEGKSPDSDRSGSAAEDKMPDSDKNGNRSGSSGSAAEGKMPDSDITLIAQNNDQAPAPAPSDPAINSEICHKPDAPAHSSDSASASILIEDNYPDEYEPDGSRKGIDSRKAEPEGSRKGVDVGKANEVIVSDSAARADRTDTAGAGGSFLERAEASAFRFIRARIRNISGRIMSMLRGRISSAFSRLVSLPGKIGRWIDIIQDSPERILDLECKILDLIARLDTKKEKIILLLDNPKKRRWMEKTAIRLKRLFIYLLPSVKKFYLHFGTGDPSLTGRLLGYFSLLYPVCEESMELVPEFEERAFEGEVGIYGRIRTVRLLIYLVPVVLNKQFFSILKKIRSL